MPDQHTAKDDQHKVYSPVRGSVPLSPDTIERVGNRLHSKLEDKETLLGKWRAWPQKNNPTDKSNVKIPLQLAAVLGIVLFITWIGITILKGNSVPEDMLPILIAVGLPAWTVLVFSFLTSLLFGGVVSATIWVGIWKAAKIAPGTIRGDKAVGMEIHGTAGRETSVTYYGHGISDERVRKLLENLHDGNIELKPIEETDAMQRENIGDSTDILVGKLIMDRNQTGDEYLSSLSPKDALTSPEGDRNSPTANIIDQIADKDVPIHCQIIATSIIGGESQRSEKYRWHDDRARDPEDWTRSEHAADASGNYLSLSIAMVAEIPSNDRRAEAEARNTMKEIADTMRNLTATGVDVNLRTKSTLEDPSMGEKLMTRSGIREENAELKDIVDGYLDREFDDTGAITMEAATAGLLLSLPGDANEVVNEALDIVPASEIPSSSLTPAAKHEIESEYEP